MALKLKLNTFKMGAEYKDTKMEEILEHLKQNLPEYEYKLFGTVGKGIKVKKSTFGGAIVSKAGRFITVKPRATSLIPAMIDSILFDLINGLSGGPKVAHNVLVCLEEKYR